MKKHLEFLSLERVIGGTTTTVTAKSPLLTGVCCALLVFALGRTQLCAFVPPAWWGSAAGPAYGIFDPTGSQVQDNYAAVNIGQLKHVATLAKAELDGRLGLTAQDWAEAFAPDASPFPFSTASNPENYAPALIGQLKFIGAGFYKVLKKKAIGYDVRSGLIAEGLGDSDISMVDGVYYPWRSSTPTAENFAPALTGQLKIVFGFDVADANSDGISDAWELTFFGTLSVNPDADPDFDGLSNSEEYSLGLNPTQPATPTDVSDEHLLLKVNLPR